MPRQYDEEMKIMKDASKMSIDPYGSQGGRKPSLDDYDSLTKVYETPSLWDDPLEVLKETYR